MEKYKIEKDSVQETLIIPLYGRRLCSQRFPGLYQDSTAAMLMEKVDYDFSPLERQANSLMQTFGALEVAMRQNDLTWEVRDYLNAHPRAAVIKSGLRSGHTGRACDTAVQHLEHRPAGCDRAAGSPASSRRREKNLAFDLKDPRWMDAVRTDPDDGAVLFAAGVFYYFTTEEVKALVTGIAKRFPGGRLAFDAAGQMAVRLMLKTWVKQAGIRDVGTYFSVKDAKGELEPWSPLFSVSSRGYMLGYQSLHDPAVRPVHWLLAKLADGPMHLQIVRIDFTEYIHG